MDSGDEVETPPAIPLESLDVKQYTCHTVQQFQSCLRQMLEPNSKALIPECVAADFYLEPDASFRISLIEEDSRRGNSEISEVSTAAVSVDAREDSARGSQADKASKVTVEKTVSTLDAVIEQSLEASHLQAAVARSVLASISEVDGFGWSLRHKARTKKDGWGFDFVCQDSKENKDRKQNRHRIRTGRAFTRENLSQYNPS
jgi:hypothetical protein